MRRVYFFIFLFMLFLQCSAVLLFLGSVLLKYLRKSWGGVGRCSDVFAISVTWKESSDNLAQMFLLLLALSW